MELKSIKVGRTVILHCRKQNAVSVTELLLLQDTAKNIILKNRRVALVDCGLVSDIAGTEYVEEGL